MRIEGNGTKYMKNDLNVGLLASSLVAGTMFPGLQNVSNPVLYRIRWAIYKYYNSGAVKTS